MYWAFFNKLWLVFTLLFVSSLSYAALYDVRGLKVDAIAQLEDDEEAPFDILASNKRHKCGGKSSNRFRVYSEFNIVSERRFSMVMNAMTHGYSLSISTHGCEGSALLVERIKVSR